MITIDEFKKNNPKKCRLIGLDLGSKRIGVAICDENQSIATPFKTIQKTTKENLIKDLNEIILENNIEGIIIGNPINMDGSLGRSAQSATIFGTATPDLTPWHMLGHSFKPIWWDDYFSWTDTTKRAALIDALIKGKCHPSQLILEVFQYLTQHYTMRTK